MSFVMTKMQITIFLIIVVVFGLLFFAVQKNNMSKSLLSPTPNPLPTGSEYLQLISPAGQQSQAAAQQQAQAQAQQQAAQQAQSAQDYNVQEPLAASISATIKTSKGDITVSLYGSDTSKAVQNFISKAERGYYTNLTFHRVEDWVIQGGDPQGNGTGGGSMPVEFNDKPFVAGSLGMASTGNGQTQNDSQFFITKSDASWLNGKYTNFGIVTDGMDVVNKIAIGDKILGITIDQ